MDISDRICSVRRGLGLNSVSPCPGLGLDLVSTPQILGLVSVSIHSGLCHDLVLVQVVLTSTVHPPPLQSLSVKN